MTSETPHLGLGDDGFLQINFVTSNKRKAEEVQRILDEAALPVKLAVCPIDLIELQGSTVEISQAKAVVASETVAGPIMVDDTSLGFEALKNMPGPYIKWYGADCATSLTKMLRSFHNKTATATCVITLITARDAAPVQFEGRVIGKIVEPRRKADTDPFDWDAIFEPTVPEAGGMTFAEMGHELKNKLSHRRRAVDLLGAYLTSKIRLTDTGSKVIDLSPEADFE